MMDHGLGSLVVMRPEDGSEHQCSAMALDNLRDLAFECAGGPCKNWGTGFAWRIVESGETFGTFWCITGAEALINI